MTMPISAIILSGGLSRRMSGQDKGLLPWRERPLIDHVIEHVHPQVDELMINANRNHPAYAERQLPIVPDEHDDNPGPLAGMAAGLAQCRHDWLLVLPCDTPQPPKDLAARLYEKAEQAPVVASLDGHMQPVFCLLHRRHRQSLIDFLARGERRARHWLRDQQAIEVDFSDQPDAFMNINQPEDLRP